MYYTIEEPEICTFNEPLMGMDLIVALGFENGEFNNLYSATFLEKSKSGIATKRHLRNMGEETRNKLMKVYMFVYSSQPSTVWFYNREQHEFFMELTRKQQMTFVWYTRDIKYFDEYAKEHQLNATLVDTNDPAKNIAFNMMSVITRKIKK